MNGETPFSATEKPDSIFEGSKRLLEDATQRLSEKPKFDNGNDSLKECAQLQTQSTENSVLSKNKREHFTSMVSYLLTTIGCAVGLGNVWRLPAIAARHGGIAFLIPYFTCTSVIGIPLVYFESFLGLFTQKGSARCYSIYMPAAGGLGVTQFILVFLLGSFYYVVTGWSCVYLLFLLLQEGDRWTMCNNDWNTPQCNSLISNAECGTGMRYVHGSNCVFINSSIPNVSSLAASEYLRYYVLQSKDPLTETMNARMLLIMAILWMIAYLVTCKGVKFMGYLAYFTTITPYFVVVTLCIYGFTLHGASEGLAHFVYDPDWTKLYAFETWGEAMAQMCLSLSLGYGAYPTLGSLNPPQQNALRDACIIVAADTAMSLLGGLAMFSIIGHMAMVHERTIETVVHNNLINGPMLAFVVYPEAIGHVRGGWFWNFIFFLMIFLLGFSTIIAVIKILSTALTDLFPTLEKWSQWVLTGVVISLYIGGIPIMSKLGGDWIDIYDFSVTSFVLFVLIALELITCFHVYGIRRFRNDLRYLYGIPRWWSLLCGMSGYYFLFNWAIIIPFFSLVTSGYMIYRLVEDLKENAGNIQVYANVARWFILMLTLLMLPLVAIAQMLLYYRRTKCWWAAFRPDPSHPTFEKTITGPKKTGPVEAQSRIAFTGTSKKENQDISTRNNSTSFSKEPVIVKKVPAAQLDPELSRSGGRGRPTDEVRPIAQVQY